MATLDWLSQDEGDTILRIGSGDTSNDTILVAMITAVSQRLDEAVGPVVVRNVADELHDGGQPTITTRLRPIYSTPGVTLTTSDGSSTTTTWTAEGFADVSDQYGYLLAPSAETGLYSGRIRARSYGADARFPTGRSNVKVSYTAGRVAATTDVPERFKQAARVTLENWWQMIRTKGFQPESGELDFAMTSFPRFAVPWAAQQLLGDVWQDDDFDLVVV